MSAPYQVGIVIPAGGRGTRFGGATLKQYLDLAGEPIIVRALRTALAAKSVCAVVVAAQKTEFAHLAGLVEIHGIADPRLVLTEGGAERYESVAKGLVHPALDAADVILVHDAVRPLASTSLFDRVAAEASVHGAVVPTIPVVDTLKRIGSDGVIIETIDRSVVRRAQTPQGFRADILRRIYSEALSAGDQVTDCSSLCERAGITVHVVEGEERNIKVTSPTDMIVAEALFLQGDS
ncbi:MAG: 2-C-methyl-D-erythritol 4-phosphate cytidylyltransferase [Candidatus Kapabacteria bacterium]|nr:2-C-methyl-D-erythritol 4-phosphate cytidylyltransferase [Candidatus Kapabacteria bacterium]